MPFLDAIPVNWFILGCSLLAGIILFLILTQIPDEDEPEKVKEPDMKKMEMEDEAMEEPKASKGRKVVRKKVSKK